MQVLLIEDDGVVAQSIQRMLELERFSVTTAALGEEGERQAKRKSLRHHPA